MYLPLIFLLVFLPLVHADLCANKTINISMYISGNIIHVNLTHWWDGVNRTFSGDTQGDNHFAIPIVHWDNRVGHMYIHRSSAFYYENCSNAPRVLTGTGVYRTCGGGERAQHDIFLMDSGRALIVNNCNVNLVNLTPLTGKAYILDWLYNTYNMSGRLGINHFNFSTGVVNNFPQWRPAEYNPNLHAYLNRDRYWYVQLRDGSCWIGQYDAAAYVLVATQRVDCSVVSKNTSQQQLNVIFNNVTSSPKCKYAIDSLNRPNVTVSVSPGNYREIVVNSSGGITIINRTFNTNMNYSTVLNNNSLHYTLYDSDNNKTICYVYFSHLDHKAPEFVKGILNFMYPVFAGAGAISPLFLIPAYSVGYMVNYTPPFIVSSLLIPLAIFFLNTKRYDVSMMAFFIGIFALILNVLNSITFPTFSGTGLGIVDNFLMVPITIINILIALVTLPITLYNIALENLPPELGVVAHIFGTGATLLGGYLLFQIVAFIYNRVRL